MKLTILLLVFVATYGCGAKDGVGNYNGLAKHSGVVSSADSAPSPNVREIDPDELQVADFGMQPSINRTVTGDLRPLWRIHGRIRNVSGYTLIRAKLQVQIWVPHVPIPPINYVNTAGNSMVDSTVLELETEIPSLSTQSFEQEIHLAPPAGQWELWCRALEAEAKPIGKKD